MTMRSFLQEICEASQDLEREAKEREKAFQSSKNKYSRKRWH
jgi:hypothetical protein